MKEKKKGRHGRIVSDRHGHPLVYYINSLVCASVCASVEISKLRFRDLDGRDLNGQDLFFFFFFFALSAVVAASMSRVEILKLKVMSVEFQDLDRQTDRVFFFFSFFRPKLMSSMLPHYMVFETWNLNFEAWEILGYGFRDLGSQL